MSIEVKEKPKQQEVIDELRGSVTSPEDLKVIMEFQAEFDEQRRQAFVEIGDTALPTLVELPDGSIVTEEERQETIADGNASGAYDGRGRA